MNPTPPQRDDPDGGLREAAERRSLCRLLDANRNRAAEALRAVEDVCRLHWELPGLARQLKELRHAVLGAVSPANLQELLAARDIEGDAGRANESPGAAADIRELALRNLQRAKEALRTLEEASRIASPDSAPALERARYELYSLERAIGALCERSPRGDRLEKVELCLLATSRLARLPLEETVAAALAGGVHMVQLREKEIGDRELLQAARTLRELTAAHGALFIVNDRPDIALLSRADGVHLGQDDLPVGAVRCLLGPSALIGVSTHGREQAVRAEREGADYVGIGPLFATDTKEAGPTLGPEAAGRIAAELRIPALAIGGIHARNIEHVAAAGFRRIAVSSALLQADAPREQAEALLRGLRSPGDPAGARRRM